MITVTRAEAKALGFYETSLDETPESLSALAYNCWIVTDDAPWPYWERQKCMDVLANLAERLGHPFI